MSQPSRGTSGTWVRPSVRNPPSCPRDWSPRRGRASHPPMTHLQVAKAEFTRIYIYFAMFKLKNWLEISTAGTSRETEGRWAVVRGWGGCLVAWTGGGGGSLQGGENVLVLGCGDARLCSGKCT